MSNGGSLGDMHMAICIGYEANLHRTGSERSETFDLGEEVLG